MKNFFTVLLCVLGMVLVLAFPQDARAQSFSDSGANQGGSSDLRALRQKAGSGGHAGRHENLPRELDYAPPAEPNISPVSFLKIEKAYTVQGRIEQLLHGIVVDVPPEYDHYGYEMRRYMASVAGPQVLGNPQRLEEELSNIHRARIILQYWRKKLEGDMAALEKEVEGPDVSPSYKTGFKYNKGVVLAFFAECGSWLDNNENVLKYLLDVGPDAYSYKDPSMSFEDKAQRAKFVSLYESRERALKQMQDYTPFRIMIY